MARAGKVKLADYPHAFNEAFETLGIVLGREDFDQKMEALKVILDYYENKKLETT